MYILPRRIGHSTERPRTIPIASSKRLKSDLRGSGRSYQALPHLIDLKLRRKRLLLCPKLAAQIVTGVDSSVASRSESPAGPMLRVPRVLRAERKQYTAGNLIGSISWEPLNYGRLMLNKTASRRVIPNSLSRSASTPSNYTYSLEHSSDVSQ
jgi:hypothetical protein